MIQVKYISKAYRHKQVLKEISFEAHCGELIAVVGKNGCGKTTLMQILAGLIKPDIGELYYFSHDMRKEKSLFRKYCGYVPQENPLMEELTVKDNLKLWGAQRSKFTETIIREFELVDLLNMPVEKMSGGMKRRLSIACAVLNGAPILLMDEPTTALDIYYKENIHQWLKKYLQKNGIIIMITHDIEEIFMCDRCLIIKEGQLTEIKKEALTIEMIKKCIVKN